MAEHIVHIDGVTGSSPVATTHEPDRRIRLVSKYNRLEDGMFSIEYFRQFLRADIIT